MTDVIPARRSTFVADIAEDRRLAASRDRLVRADYDPAAAVERSAVDAWPGDLVGRLLLSWSRLARGGHIDHERVRTLFELMIKESDTLGFFGHPLTDPVDEQQVACHGWVASAYVQYAYAVGDERGFAAGERVVDELLLPALARFDDYPRERAISSAGAPSGAGTEIVNGWLLSTDTWCVLLALNGLVPVWEQTRRHDIAVVIERLVATLAAIDLVEQRAQLHATLAAARCAARYAELSGSPRARSTAVDIYRTYVDHGRTLNWATYNWFGRPETWTEPCAIVDSIGLALALWRLTGEDDYARDVVRIEENALAFAERADGSFGLDSIATAADPELRVITMDAHWCCTMRGCVGLMDVRDHAALWQRDGLSLVLPRTGTVDGDDWQLRTELSQDRDHLQVHVLHAPPDGQPLRVRSPFFEADVMLLATVGANVMTQLRWLSWTQELAGGSLVVERERIMVRTAPDRIPLSALRATLTDGAKVPLRTARPDMP